MAPRKEKVDALREELRNGRVSTTGEDFSPDNGNNDPTFGTTFQDARREVNVSSNIGRPLTDNRPGIEKEPVRVGPGDRRSGKDNGGVVSSVQSPDSTAEPTSTIGRLETEGPIPARKLIDDPIQQSFSTENRTYQELNEKYPTLKSILEKTPDISHDKLGSLLGVSASTARTIKIRWNEQKNALPPPTVAKAAFQLPNIPNLGSKGRTLTEKEATELSGSFPEALLSNFNALDEYLWFRQKGVGIDHHNEPVWSDVDDEELQALTRLMLKGGKRNQTMAAVVRLTVDTSDYIAVGTVFVPRFVRTVDIIKKTRQPRKRRGSIEG